MAEKIEVIIPAYRPGREFEKLIRRLKKQTCLPDTIHVINTISEQFPAKFCMEQGIRVTHIEKAQFDHGGTRDMGIRQSDADIVVFMTQDAVPCDKYLIENLTKPFEREDVGAAYARQLPRKDCHVIERYTRSFNYPEKSRLKGKEDLPVLGIKTFFCSDVCAAYSRKAYEETGGFEKKTIFNEDMILAGHMIEKGYKIAYAAEARVIHSHNYTGAQQFHRNFDLAVSQADHPEVFEGVASESEGIRLVKSAAKYLLREKKGWLIPGLIWQSGCKYLGYWLGRRYRQLPGWLIKKCTMSQSYWEK